MLCKVCGAQIPDDAVECEFCGAQIKEEELANQEQDTVSETDEQENIFDDNDKIRREQMKKMLENKKRQLSEIERRRIEKRKREKRNKIILIAVICALAVAASGIGVYYVTDNIMSNNSTNLLPTPTAAATALPTMSVITPAPSAAVTPAASAGIEPRNVNASGTNVNSSSAGASLQSRPSGGNGSLAGGGSSSGTSSSSGNSQSRPSGGNTSSSSGSGSGANVVNSGISSSKISAQLSTGGEVIKNTGTGRYLMTFITGGKRYYANVSEGSTTDQVKDKHYTITAEPTAETYNGNTVYEITTFTKYDGKDYILMDSGTRLLTNDDIKGMSKYDLALARNEIYARHGRKFQTAEYNEYFTSKSWYSLNPNYNYSDDDSNLNSIEIKNVQFILSAERR